MALNLKSSKQADALYTPPTLVISRLANIPQQVHYVVLPLVNQINQHFASAAL